MCMASTPDMPPPPPPPADPPPAPDVQEQLSAPLPIETRTEQALAAKKGLAQLRILPGLSFTNKQWLNGNQ